jgi:hypothetical protein
VPAFAQRPALGSVRLDREHGEHEALPRTAEVDLMAVALGPQAAEHP